MGSIWGDMGVDMGNETGNDMGNGVRGVGWGIDYWCKGYRMVTCKDGMDSGRGWGREGWRGLDFQGYCF